MFRVAHLVCAAEVAAVREILPRPTATRVPGAAPAVVGLINVRGALITLLDGRRALGLSDTPGTGTVILLDLASRTVGLAVDEVLDLITTSADDLAQREDLPGIDARLVRAIGRRADVTYVLLDFDALLGPILTS